MKGLCFENRESDQLPNAKSFSPHPFQFCPDLKITSVIKACGYTRGSKEDKQKALMILLECMAEMKSTKYLSPTSITYRSLLNAARALVADDARRHPISQTIFETCCRNGQLDTTVLEALQKVQPELYVKLPTDIPSKWKRNISQGRPGYR